jgi:hypothetical protein
MKRLARIALLIVSVVSFIVALLLIHFLPELTAYGGLISASAVAIVAIINLGANVVQIIDFFDSKLQSSNEIKTETGRDLFTPILLDIRHIKELVNSTSLKEIDLTVWKSKANDYLFLRLDRKTKDAVKNFYNQVEKSNIILEKLLTRVQGIISTSLYEFSEGILVAPVDWESEYLEGYSEEFNKECSKIAETIVAECCIEVLRKKEKFEVSHALYSTAFDMLEKDGFKALGVYIDEDDYDILGGKAVDYSDSFSKKTEKIR